MKKLFLLPCMLLLASCASYLPAPKSITGMIDYSTLTKNGIFVTESNSVNFDYEAVGSIYAEEVGGFVRKDGKPDPIDPRDDYYIGSSSGKKVYVRPDVQAAFEKLISKLSQSGANGLINMKIQFTTEQDLISKVIIDKIIVSGMAIKK